MLKFILQLKDISKGDVRNCGGKGANLGELKRIGMPVPNGFVVLASAFERFLEETDVNVEIEAMWRRINIKDIESVEENSEILRDLIIKAKMPEELKEEILVAFKKLRSKYVAIRSSATAEDSKIDAWAGQLETHLNTAEENLIENIKNAGLLYMGQGPFFIE